MYDGLNGLNQELGVQLDGDERCEGDESAGYEQQRQYVGVYDESNDYRNRA